MLVDGFVLLNREGDGITSAVIITAGKALKPGGGAIRQLKAEISDVALSNAV